MDTFCVDLKKVEEEGKLAEFNQFMDTLQDAYVVEAQGIQKQFGVSDSCALNIQYLRSRSRWTQELENELIRMDKEDKTQPNIMDWP